MWKALCRDARLVAMPTKQGACIPNKGHAQRRPLRRHAPQCCLPRGYSPRRYSPALRGHQPGLSSAVVSRAIPSSVRPRPPRRHASGGSRLSRPPRRHASGGSRLSPSSAAWLPPRVRSSRRSAAIGPAVAAQPGIGSDVLLRFAYGVDVGNRDCPLRYCLGYFYEHHQRQVAGLECHRPSRIFRRPKAWVQSQIETITADDHH